MDPRPRPRYFAVAAATVGALLVMLGLATEFALKKDEKMWLLPWIIVGLGLLAIANGVAALVRAGEDHPRRRRGTLPARPPGE